MSKTVENLIEKCRRLIAGASGRTGELKQLGVSESQLTQLDASLQQLAVMSNDCEAMRAQLHDKVAAMHTALDAVKGSFLSIKGTIKQEYPQAEWIEWGIDDKR